MPELQQAEVKMVRMPQERSHKRVKNKLIKDTSLKNSYLQVLHTKGLRPGPTKIPNYVY